MLTFTAKCRCNQLVRTQPVSEIALDGPWLTVGTPYEDSVKPELHPLDIRADRNLNRVDTDHEEEEIGDE
jgi:hypothetical protein